MKLTVIDAYGFLFRAYYVLPHLTTSYGLSIGGVYGFINILLKHLNNNTEFLVVVFDTGNKNFRHDMYSQYKSNRPQLPGDLILQFPILREAVKALNIAYEEIEGYEADDVIASISKKYSAQNIKITIISSDKDLLQLLNDNVAVYDPIKNKYLTKEYVKEKFGIESNQLLDFLSLTGDSSDNIPGVPGIGIKTAAKLINEFSNLENILNNAHEIKQKKCRDSLMEYKEQALLSKKLVSLYEDVNLNSHLNDYALKEPSMNSLVTFLQKYEFQSLINRIVKQSNNNQKTSTVIHCAYSRENLQLFLKKCTDIGIIAIHVECDNNILKKLSLACIEDSDLVINEENLEYAMKEITPILKQNFILKIMYNVKSLLNFFPDIESFDDVMLMSYSTDTGLHDHKLESIISYNLHENQSTFNAKTLIRLHKILKTKLLSQSSYTIYERFEKPLIKVIHTIEKEGIMVDKKILSALSENFSNRISILEKEIYELAQESFNIRSPKQLSFILYDKMNIGQKKKLKSGIYSTGAETLEELSMSGIEIADKLLQWRHLDKLKNTYTDALPKQINDLTQRIHTTYMMATTSTGRLSSSEPNLQNIPIKTQDGTSIRRAFIAKEGYTLISADYSQIELRLLAHIANVQAFKNSFVRNEDIHVITAQQIFHTTVIDKHLRRKAKAINFGIIYGISPFGLAKQLKISMAEAKQYIDYYFFCYPEIKNYMENIKSYARNYQYVTTLFGRRCFIKNISNKNIHLRNIAERAAINAPIQGTAADIIKRAMIKLFNILNEGKIILQIHDELLVEVINESVPYVASVIQNTLENVVTLSTALKVDINIGNNWNEMKRYN